MSFEIYLIMCLIGGILIINGLRKMRRRDLFIQIPLVGWVLVFLTFVFQLFQLDLFFNDVQDSWILYIFLLIMGIAAVVLFIKAIQREMNQTRIRIHNMAPEEVEEMVIAQLQEKEVDYRVEDGDGKRRIFTFPLSEGEIILESDYFSKNHQLINFHHISEIPSCREIIEDIQEESERRERPLPLTLGVSDLLIGGMILLTGIFLIQL